MPAKKDQSQPVEFHPENVAVGERIKLARRFAGFRSGKDFATALNINYITYNNYERGRNAVKMQGVFEKMAEKTGVSATWLKTGKGAAVMDNPERNSQFQELIPRATPVMEKQVNDALLIMLYQELETLTKSKNIAPVELLRLALQSYRYIIEASINEEEQLAMVKGAAKLVVAIAHPTPA